MSYCRPGPDSDVYVYPTGSSVVCVEAREAPRIYPLHPDEEFFITKSKEKMIEHLLAHRAGGALVPERALERLRQELSGESSS